MSEPQGLKFVRAAAGRLADLATVLAYPGFCARDPKYGITSRKPPQRDPSIEIHAPVPEGEVYSQLTIDGICDRGTGKSALLCFPRHIVDASSQAPIATVRQVNVLRTHGRFGGTADRTPPGPERPDRAFLESGLSGRHA